jgi:hypothetical protein
MWTRGLLIRRNIADGEMAFFSTWCPAGTRIEALVTVEGHRWASEDSFETAKNELGLDHNETRSWHGWHRHSSGPKTNPTRSRHRMVAPAAGPSGNREASSHQSEITTVMLAR